MKNYYIIKAYCGTRIGDKYIDRWQYFGKANQLIGYKTEAGSKRYTANDIRDHGYRSYKDALEAAWALEDEERSPGWQVSFTVLTEIVSD